MITEEERNNILREEHMKRSAQGGKSTYKKYGLTHYQQMQKRGVKARKRNKKEKEKAV